jgi:hypothetical protein
MLTATPLDLPTGTAMLTLTILLPVSRQKRDLIDGIVAMLEDTLFLDAAPDLEVDCGYRWSLGLSLVAPYIDVFKSYFDFLDIRCVVTIAPTLRPV